MQAAGIILVRPDGSLLLQHRDEHAPTDPNRWAIPGGLVHPEEDPMTAARRELLEETGLVVTGPLPLFWSGVTAAHGLTAHVYYAATDAELEDIVVGEGRAMTFVPGQQVLHLDLAPNSRPVLNAFLSSPDYLELCTAPRARASLR